MKVAIAQIAPVFLDRERTLAKVLQRIEEAGRQECGLVCFPEVLVPGYPVWLDRTHGAAFDNAEQKEIYSIYLAEAVDICAGQLARVQEAARDCNLAVVLGTAERGSDRGNHTIYCSRVFIDPRGTIGSVHRKLMPTYEERLVWGIGDGAGLVTHPVGPFRVGALNCWENWIPMARMALYGAGEDLHVALWPGVRRNTIGSTPFIAFESRSYVVAASGVLRDQDIPGSIPMRDRIVRQRGEVLLNGGSALAGPDGNLIIEPVVDIETLLVHELEYHRVLEERQNFDLSGHYARPDVLRLRVERRRQAAVSFFDEDPQEPGPER